MKKVRNHQKELMMCTERALTSLAGTVGWNFLTCWWCGFISGSILFSDIIITYQTLFFSRSGPLLPVVGLDPAVSVVKRYQISRESREELLDITGQRDPSLFHLFAFDNPQKMSHVWPESEVIDEPRISANYQRFWLTINSFQSSGNNDSKSPIIGGARFDFLE